MLVPVWTPGPFSGSVIKPDMLPAQACPHELAAEDDKPASAGRTGCSIKQPRAPGKCNIGPNGVCAPAMRHSARPCHTHVLPGPLTAININNASYRRCLASWGLPATCRTCHS